MLIERVRIKGFWNKYSLDWQLNKDVNILSGVNGSGKSTLLNIIHSVLYSGTLHSTVENKIKEVDIELTEGYRVICEHKNDQIVTIYKHNGLEISRSGMDSLRVEFIPLLNFPISGKYFLGPEMYKYQNDFRSKINEMFSLTNKRLDDTTSKLRFVLEDGTIIYPCDLSSGEKRLLNFLTFIRIQDGQDFILLWDEPETSMCIDWQRSIIRVAREINPSVQLILVTHSPSIIYEGWEKRVMNMEDLLE